MERRQDALSARRSFLQMTGASADGVCTHLRYAHRRQRDARQTQRPASLIHRWQCCIEQMNPRGWGCDDPLQLGEKTASQKFHPKCVFDLFTIGKSQICHKETEIQQIHYFISHKIWFNSRPKKKKKLYSFYYM